jgi:paraquat-inducible protein A
VGVDPESLGEYKTAASIGLTGCHHCAKVQSSKHQRCVRCHSTLHVRKQNSLQRSWALLIASIVCYIPANILPVMYTNQLGQQSGKSILGGIVLLWELGSEPIAAVIFIASVLVPLGKLMALAWFCFSAQTGRSTFVLEQTVLYRLVEFVGRWSMIDVFVVAVLASLIQMGNLVSIYPGPAALPFACMVILTMIAANSFDTRLIWDSYDRQR